MGELDLLLYRTLKDGKQFDKLIPKVKCESTDLGKGMTDYSVEKMAEWVQQYAWQMQKVAPLLKQRSLQDTCHTIHNWCYDHFQYRADTDDQLLRSPACSWAQRYEGIDCKSYSIIASAILLNLGIDHYIRRIKQPGFSPDLWTHVYVVVPDNQSTGNLDGGYYVIDGTMQEDDEPMYNEISDLYMSMQHYGLNGAYGQEGLNGISFSSIKDILSKGFSLKNLSCIGGSTTSADFDAVFAIMAPYFDMAFASVNSAIASNSPTTMAQVNKLLTNATQIKDHAANTAAYNWKSACTKDALNAYKALGEYYFNIVNGAFKGWLENYFLASYGAVSVVNNTFEPLLRNSAGKGFDKNQFARQVQVQVLKSLVLKSTANMKVVAFELTPYVAEKSTTSNGVNILEMFKGLQTVVASFNPTTTTTGTTSSIKNGTPGGGSTIDSSKINDTPKTTAGGGTVGILLALGGLGLLAANAFNKTPSTGPGAKKPGTTTTRRKAVTKKKAK